MLCRNLLTNVRVGIKNHLFSFVTFNRLGIMQYIRPLTGVLSVNFIDRRIKAIRYVVSCGEVILLSDSYESYKYNEKIQVS
jgi:hypothetical protein